MNTLLDLAIQTIITKQIPYTEHSLPTDLIKLIQQEEIKQICRTTVTDVIAADKFVCNQLRSHHWPNSLSHHVSRKIWTYNNIARCVKYCQKKQIEYDYLGIIKDICPYVSYYLCRDSIASISYCDSFEKILD
jgi:hypothetical protein